MPAEDVIRKDIKLRLSKDFNGVIEKGRGGVKASIAPMLGFEIFTREAVMVSAIVLLHRIRKGLFAVDRLGVYGQAAPAIWTTVREVTRSCRRFVSEPRFLSRP